MELNDLATGITLLKYMYSLKTTNNKLLYRSEILSVIKDVEFVHFNFVTSEVEKI